jgi:hypothetical protein
MSDKKASDIIDSLKEFGSVDQADKQLRVLVGDDWDLSVMPRRIASSGDYYNPRHWWAISTMKSMCRYTMTHGNLGKLPQFSVFTTEEANRDIEMFAITHKSLHDHDGPTYFVTKDLMEALDRTDVEQTIPMEELKFPHDSMLFVLPISARYAEAKGIFGKASSLVMLTVTRVPHEKFEMAYIVTMIDTNGSSAYSLYPCKGTYGEQIAEHGEKFLMENPTEFYREMYEQSVNLDALNEDKRQAHMGTRLVWKLLCAMNAANETVTVGGSIVREAREATSRKPARVALWSPLMLDLSQRIETSDDDSGRGAGVRLHWRRGHFRRQAHGTGRMQRKMVWIKPHKVGSL